MKGQGTSIKDTWTKPKGADLRVGGRDVWGGECGEGKWRQLYLNNNKKNFLKEKNVFVKLILLPELYSIFSW